MEVQYYRAANSGLAFGVKLWSSQDLLDDLQTPRKSLFLHERGEGKRYTLQTSSSAGFRTDFARFPLNVAGARRRCYGDVFPINRRVRRRRQTSESTLTFRMEGSEVIDFSSVERELKAAIESDEKYRRENEAKFRALRQNVGSYEEFRDIVLASHLKPLERKDVAGARWKQPWNPICSASRRRDHLYPKETETGERGENLQQIFSIEVGLGVLGDFLVILAECLRPGDEPEVLAVLEGLSKTSRFSLNVSFLDGAEKEACVKLFHRLLSVSDEQHSDGKCGRTCRRSTEPGETEAEVVSMRAAARLLVLLLLYGAPRHLGAYEAPKEKEDMFSSLACPAFLLFNNVAYVTDTTLTLPCICKAVEAQSVVWYFQKELGSNNTRALTDFDGRKVADAARAGRSEALESRFSINLFSLVIYRAQEADSGHYICGTASGQYFYAYYVDIQKVCSVSLPQSSVVLSCSAGQGGEAGASEFYNMFTNYSEWTVCDRCGVRGEQTRTGLCYLSSPYLHVRYRSTLEGANSCGSPAVPGRLQLAVKGAGAKMEVRDCEVPCPPHPPPLPDTSSFLVVLAYGKKADQVPVFYENHPEGAHVILTCPGAKPEYAVAWDWDQVRLYRSLYMEGLNKEMRLYIDTGNHLHFEPLRREDKGSYYCWLQGKVAAKIKLGVFLPLVRQHDMLDRDLLDALKIVLVAYAVLTCVFLLILLAKFTWRSYKVPPNE
ncbi:Ig-like V-type domain-containing protein FAM187A [Arapaima gigas]